MHYFAQQRFIFASASVSDSRNQYPRHNCLQVSLLSRSLRHNSRRFSSPHLRRSLTSSMKRFQFLDAFNFLRPAFRGSKSDIFPRLLPESPRNAELKFKFQTTSFSMVIYLVPYLLADAAFTVADSKDWVIVANSSTPDAICSQATISRSPMEIATRIQSLYSRDANGKVYCHLTLS